ASLKQKGIRDKDWGVHVPWGWIRQLCALRLQRNLGPMISKSADEHGIKLTASFHPFETALTKYYEIPTFDHSGKYLWGFLPMATPVVNYHPEDSCFAHYRTLLRGMGQEGAGQLGSLEIRGVENADSFLQRFEKTRDNLRIIASNYAPLQEDSLVLQRQLDGQFRLRPFGEFKQQANQHQLVLTEFRVEKHGSGVRITNLQVPQDYRYLILSNPSAEEALDLPTLEPGKLFAKAGNALGRENVYWVLDEDETLSRQTRVPGILNTGGPATEFHATDIGYRHLYKKGEARTVLKDRLLVIDLGAPYSVEMMDLNQPAMRENVVKEMKTLLALPAFDELFINTRSHVSLSAYQADGDEGIKPRVYYRQEKKRYTHIGIDRAYAPLGVVDDPLLREWAADPKLVERITTWQEGEWEGRCQSEVSPYRWRYARNTAVADGVRLLLEDFETVFPGVRTRAVIPMSEPSVNRVLDEMESLQRPDGTPYGRDYNRLWSSYNHIRSIGEGMAMLDLSGLKTEPVLFGIRGVPDAAPFDIHFEESLRDLSDNRGSAFRGPRSFFFEAQYSLLRKDYEVARKQREDLICKVLSYKEDVKEVILYESADWLYYLPFSDRDLIGNYFIERCGDTQ
ncbi:MAG: hypothetical protein L3K26_19715, partial [Candidatus Hydrogenedentes bacterium]|nr:hypothetical protein [Candidatus Hydrogenedentota bacterium]